MTTDHLQAQFRRVKPEVFVIMQCQNNVYLHSFAKHDPLCGNVTLLRTPMRCFNVVWRANIKRMFTNRLKQQLRWESGTTHVRLLRVKHSRCAHASARQRTTSKQQDRCAHVVLLPILKLTRPWHFFCLLHHRFMKCVSGHLCSALSNRKIYLWENEHPINVSNLFSFHCI